MSSGAVAASDPGGGETKLAAGADVTMSEAEGEVPAFSADVKVEGKAPLAMDVAHEGGDVAVTDPLYATESAGMVGAEGPGDEHVEGVDAVNGEDGGEEGTLEAGAGGLLPESERKPVLVVDVATAAGSATPEHAEAGKETAQSPVLVGVLPTDGTVLTKHLELYSPISFQNPTNLKKIL